MIAMIVVFAVQLVFVTTTLDAAAAIAHRPLKFAFVTLPGVPLRSVFVTANAVKLPDLRVVAPMTMLSMLPAVAGAMVTVPVPVGEIVTLALAGDMVVAAVLAINDP